MQQETKRCATCGKEFGRQQDQTQASWDAKRFCSSWCFCHPPKTTKAVA